MLPPEIVREIAEHVLLKGCIPRNLGSSTAAGANPKAPWPLIQAFSLSSQSFRQIALSLWFQYLFLRSATDLDIIDQWFPEVKSTWCRNVHCVQLKDHHVGIWNFAGFKRLDHVRVDWLRPDLTILDSNTLDDPDRVPFVNVECPIRVLDIRGLRYPSPMALRSFTLPFTELVVLKLEVMRVWCGLCHTCAIVRFPPPAPTDFVYEGGLGLSVHYARSLFPLKTLEEVHITLPDFGSGRITPWLSATINEAMWTGECDRCIALMYEDESFRMRWLAAKQGSSSSSSSTHEMRHYLKPPSLTKVRWNIWDFNSPRSSDPSHYSQEEVDTDDIMWLMEDGDGEDEAA